MPPLQKRLYRCVDEYGRRRWCGLSTGAKWGIAWGVIVGAFLLFFIFGWLLRNRRRRARMIAVQPPPQQQYQPPPQPPQAQPYYPMTMGTQPQPPPPPQGSQPFAMPEPAVPFGKQYDNSAWTGPTQSPMTAPTGEQSGVSYPPPPGPPPPAYQTKA